jgi:3-deoxy-D-manno-octulosonic-acid transferase
MRTFYSLGILFYTIALNIVSVFNTKASLWVKGRKRLLYKIRQEVKSDNIIWIHTASVGEFEQARPLIERIKTEMPSKKILITFFSPSGYELRKSYELADYIYYLPVDTKANAKEFLDIVKPNMVFFVKYEFWFNFIREINNRNIPLYLVSGIFRPKQHFFKWYGEWFRKHLQMFNYLFVQDKSSADLLNSIGINNCSITGDTRFDRVNAVTLNPKKFECIQEFIKGSKVLLAGSTWAPDEDIILDYMKEFSDNMKLIIAPHEVTKSHINSIESTYKLYKPVKLSELEDGKKLDNNSLLIVDSVGKLAYLYQYTDIAYIGGGFGVGIHNILEAACYAKPVIFGPNYQKFKEARDLIELGGAFSVKNSNELKDVLNSLLKNNEIIKAKNKVCFDYVKQNLGATDKIFKYCFDSKR